MAVGGARVEEVASGGGDVGFQVFSTGLPGRGCELEVFGRGAEDGRICDADAQEAFDEVGERAECRALVNLSIKGFVMDLPDSIHKQPEPRHGLRANQDTVEEKTQREQNVSQVRSRLSCRDSRNHKMCEGAAEQEEFQHEQIYCCSARGDTVRVRRISIESDWVVPAEEQDD